LMGQREHDVKKIRDVEQLLFSGLEPVLACLCLALGAVPIAGPLAGGPFGSYPFRTAMWSSLCRMS
jgi:hypothetical protein